MCPNWLFEKEIFTLARYLPAQDYLILVFASPE